VKIRITGKRIVWWLAAFAALVAIGVVVWVLMPDENKGKNMATTGKATPGLSADDLAKAARTKVFFGHQSVGGNVLSGVPAVFAEHGVAAPPVTEGRVVPSADGGYLLHSPIGQNEQPLSKIKDFEVAIRGGLGQKVDVAMMKLCYIDITAETDIDALFVTYRDTMAALERDFPKVTFVKVTVPLTTEQNGKAQVKASMKRLLGRGARMGSDENVARERLNALIRAEYADNHLFDLAAVESTDPDGKRVSGDLDGQPYFALYNGYASDNGHLNSGGAKVAATAWLTAIARASSR
jgi:hypothetical protein